LKLHTLKGYIQNVFLVEYEHGLALLDGCSRADVDMICAFIGEHLGRPLTDLKLIVVTHMHPDHAGGAHKLRKISGCQIASHPKAPFWYRGLVGKFAHLTDVILTYWVAGRLGRKKRHIWYSPKLKPNIELADDQPLPIFNDWQVLFTPGHTDHDLSLWHSDSNTLYIADLIVMVKRQLVPPFPVCHPNQYRRSLQRIAALPSPNTFFAHVPARSLGADDFQQLLMRAPDKPKNMWRATKSRIKHVFR
jgi:glyoxylase-like metal-dependent hydrolase (beta-lactamase superfamily II)